MHAFAQQSVKFQYNVVKFETKIAESNENMQTWAKINQHSENLCQGLQNFTDLLMELYLYADLRAFIELKIQTEFFLT